MSWIIIAAWFASGAIGSALIAVWWTSELPLTTDELPGLIFSALMGPANLLTGICLVLSLALKKFAALILPKGRSVIFRQWGR